jgi:hypothetical protein
VKCDKGCHCKSLKIIKECEIKKPTAQQMQDWIFYKEFFDGYFEKEIFRCFV